MITTRRVGQVISEIILNALNLSLPSHRPFEDFRHEGPMWIAELSCELRFDFAHGEAFLSDFLSNSERLPCERKGEAKRLEL
jgi:hypothetical protein